MSNLDKAPAQLPQKKLPTLAELNSDIEVAFKNDDLNILLNQPPPDKWLKKHPFAKDVTYLPIEKIEFLLTRIFQRYTHEIIGVMALFNSVCVWVRLGVLSPVTGEWIYHDGIGAVGIQTEAGASASDLSKIRQDAVMKAAPAAKSYALKDAAEHLGIIFGKNLNRKDTIGFSPSFDDETREEIKKRMSEQAKNNFYGQVQV